MSKRFTDSEIWKQDWFVGMPYEYIMLWFYVKDNCDYAGIWKPNKAFVEFVSKKPIDLKRARDLFNAEDKDRVRVLPNGRWLLPDFFSFQYGHTINPHNPVHRSILEVLKNNNVDPNSLRGVGAGSGVGAEDGAGVKDKDKDNTTIKTTTTNHSDRPKFPVAQDYFYKKFQEVMGKKYVANFGKDGAIFKELIGIMGDTDVIAAVDRFFASDDEFIKKSGYTIGVFRSQINKLIGDKKRTSIIFKKEG